MIGFPTVLSTRTIKSIVHTKYFIFYFDIVKLLDGSTIRGGGGVLWGPGSWF